MIYNDNLGKKCKLIDDNEGLLFKRCVIMVVRYCREILVNKGMDFVFGNGDCILYFLIDIEGKVIEKVYFLCLFDLVKM